MKVRFDSGLGAYAGNAFRINAELLRRKGKPFSRGRTRRWACGITRKGALNRQLIAHAAKQYRDPEPKGLQPTPVEGPISTVLRDWARKTRR